LNFGAGHISEENEKTAELNKIDKLTIDRQIGRQKDNI
jgi:hypothetical protein